MKKTIGDKDGVSKTSFFSTTYCAKLVNKIYQRYTEKIEAFGLDENWLDVTDSISLYNDDGKISSLFLVFSGRKWKIDCIYDVQQSRSEAGGCGICYEVRVDMRKVYLYYEELTKCWFIERKT